LIKSINISRNTLKNNSNNYNSIPTPTPNTTSNLQKVAKNPFPNNDQLKGIRKSAFSNMNLCQNLNQNNKPQRRVSCKKEQTTITHQIQQNNQQAPLLSLKTA
jgi:hypothetical protein